MTCGTCPSSPTARATASARRPRAPGEPQGISTAVPTGSGGQFGAPALSSTITTTNFTEGPGMDPLRHAKLATAALLAVAALATAAPVALATPPDRHGGGGGAAPAGTRLPPSWPKDVPVPPGQVTGTNIGPGHAVVQLIVRGDAAQALRATIAF